MSRCQDSRRRNDGSSAKHNVHSDSPQTHLEYENSTTNNPTIVALPYVKFSYKKIINTYDKRPRIRDSFGSTDNADCWGSTLRWWSRTNTTGDILLPRIRWSCCKIFDISRDTADGRLIVEWIRPERKIWVWQIIETGVRIGRNRSRISEIATCKTSRR